MVLEISEQKGSFKISSLLQLELKLFLGLVTLPSLERLLPSDFVSELHSETPRNWRFVLLVLLGVERALSSRRDDSFLFKSAHLRGKKTPNKQKTKRKRKEKLWAHATQSSFSILLSRKYLNPFLTGNSESINLESFSTVSEVVNQKQVDNKPWAYRAVHHTGVSKVDGIRAAWL